MSRFLLQALNILQVHPACTNPNVPILQVHSHSLENNLWCFSLYLFHNDVRIHNILIPSDVRELSIHKLENVQRYFTRRLFSYRSHSYKERLQLLNLESLEARRLKYDLKMYFKIIHNLINILIPLNISNLLLPI